MVLQEHIEPFRLKQMLLIHVKTSNVILSVSIPQKGKGGNQAYPRETKGIYKSFTLIFNFFFSCCFLLCDFGKEEKENFVKIVFKE